MVDDCVADDSLLIRFDIYCTESASATTKCGHNQNQYKAQNSELFIFLHCSLPLSFGCLYCITLGLICQAPFFLVPRYTTLSHPHTLCRFFYVALVPCRASVFYLYVRQYACNVLYYCTCSLGVLGDVYLYSAHLTAYVLVYHGDVLASLGVPLKGADEGVGGAFIGNSSHGSCLLCFSVLCTCIIACIALFVKLFFRIFYYLFMCLLLAFYYVQTSPTGQLGPQAMATALHGSLIDNLAVLSLVAMLCASILGTLSSSSEAVASLVVLEFVVVHHYYYLLCSLCLYYSTSLIVCQEFFLLLSEHLYNCTVSSLHSHAVDGDVGMSTTGCVHGAFIGDQMPSCTNLFCFPSFGKVILCVSAHCVVLLLASCLSLLCICIIAHEWVFVKGSGKLFFCNYLLPFGVHEWRTQGVRHRWTVQCACVVDTIGSQHVLTMCARVVDIFTRPRKYAKLRPARTFAGRAFDGGDNTFAVCA